VDPLPLERCPLSDQQGGSRPLSCSRCDLRRLLPCRCLRLGKLRCRRRNVWPDHLRQAVRGPARSPSRRQVRCRLPRPLNLPLPPNPCIVRRRVPSSMTIAYMCSCRRPISHTRGFSADLRILIRRVDQSQAVKPSCELGVLPWTLTDDRSHI
jgi:hypothetical protein